MDGQHLGVSIRRFFVISIDNLDMTSTFACLKGTLAAYFATVAVRAPICHVIGIERDLGQRSATAIIPVRIVDNGDSA